MTDVSRRIVHINTAFTRITGYSEEEVLGKNPGIFKSGRHDRAFYDALWHALDSRDGWSGEIWNRRKSGEIYPQWQTIRAVRDSLGEITHYVAVFSDITILKRSQDELDFIAHHDPLTSLPNRLLFMERVDHAMRRPVDDIPGGAVLIIDLDHFAHVNESLGHAAGDQLLRAVGERLQTLLLPGMTLARMGGDEFGVLNEDCPGAEQAAAFAQQLLDALRTPFALDDRELFISASVGVSLFPIDGETVSQVLRNADSALSKAKGAGRECYAFYTSELTLYAHQRVQLLGELRQALERDQLRVFYQPIYDLASGRLRGVESLVRWEHPERGMVSPAEFIPVAEESGLIGVIDGWVLEQACRQLKAWQQSGRSLEFVAVNISSRLFSHGGLEQRVAAILADTGLDPACLELEVTESAVMDNPDEALAMLERLRDLGVRLSIDDFGTGHSSLLRLKRLPVHKLKIDQGFVRGLPQGSEDAAIARMVIALAKSLGLQVVAEGIEQAEQVAFLLEQQCDMGQGYLFDRPCPAAELRWPAEVVAAGMVE